MKASQNNLRRSKLSKPYRLLLPSLITLYTLIGIGVVSAILETLKHLNTSMQLFSSSDFYLSLGLSLRLAFTATLMAVGLAIGLLYLLFLLTLTQQQKGRTPTKNTSTIDPSRIFSRLFQTPMLIPYIVSGYLVFLTFGQSGLLSRLSFALGFTDSITAFPILVNDPSGIGIILAFVWKTTPFMILMLYPVMTSLDSKFLDMSRVFGMKPTRYYWSVLLPHMASTIAFSGFIVFAYTLTSFEVPYMLGATYPKTLSVSAYQLYTGGSIDERHMALTMSMVLFFISLGLGYLAFKHAQSYQKHLQGGRNS